MGISELARKEGFEPSRRFYPAYSLSRGAPSATWVLPRIVMHLLKIGGESGIRTHGHLRAAGFQDRFLQPLGHLSTGRRRLLNPSGIIAYLTPVCQQIFIRLCEKQGLSSACPIHRTRLGRYAVDPQQLFYRHEPVPLRLKRVHNLQRRIHRCGIDIVEQDDAVGLHV